MAVNPAAQPDQFADAGNMVAAAQLARRPGAPLSAGEGMNPGNEVDAPNAPNLEKLKRFFTESRDLTQRAREASLKALDYYDSDQFTPEQRAALARRHQPEILNNRIKPAINGILGVSERSRTDPRCWPNNPNNTDAADVATDVLRFVAQYNRFRNIKRDCFRDMLVPGTMAALVGVDGDLQVEITQIRWEEFFADPRARRADWKDARYIGIAKWMYADDVAELYPEKADEIQATVLQGIGAGLAPDASYQDRPLHSTGTAAAWIDKRMRRLMVVEMYYQEKGWKRCVFTASDVLEFGPSPYLNHKGRPDCPIEAHSAYVKRDNSRYGLVHDMIGVQDEITQRRSKSLHVLATSRIQASDPMAIDIDVEEARREAAKPDGVIPRGWQIVPNSVDFEGNIELLTEAKAEIDRMGLPPAMMGRSDDTSGRHLQARQQAGITELSPIFGAFEDWELRIYRQVWARVRQYWKAPQFIRVTDDEDAPRFVGINQPIQGDPMPTIDPTHPNGVSMQRPVLGYENSVAEMDVDIDIEVQNDVASIASEQFSELVELVKLSPTYQQQAPLSMLIQLSTIPHKRAMLDAIKQAAQEQQAAQAKQQQMAEAMAEAKLGETQAKTAEITARAPLHQAIGFAKVSDALTYAHTARSDGVVSGLTAGIDHAQKERAFAESQDAQMSDQQHQAAMAAQAQQQEPDADDGQGNGQ